MGVIYLLLSLRDDFIERAPVWWSFLVSESRKHWGFWSRRLVYGSGKTDELKYRVTIPVRTDATGSD